MKKITLTALAVFSALLLIFAGCSEASDTTVVETTSTSAAAPETSSTAPAEPTSTTASETVPEPTPEPTTETTEEPAPVLEFPRTVTDDTGEVTISESPARIVSLSPTATEMLFAIGAGPQVVAADSFSNFPPEAPTTDLSGFQPNIEAISTYEPDLVVISFDPGDLTAGLRALGAEVLKYSAAPTLDDAFQQMISLGEATGNAEQAEEVVAELQEDIDLAVADLVLPAEPFTYYLELDPTLFSVTSSSFIGQIFELAGLESIADAAEGAAGGFPQLSEEFILNADPDFIFLTDRGGESLETLMERAGWDSLDAIIGSRVVVFDSDIISRWGPRVVELLDEVAMIVANELAVLAS